MFVEKTNWVLGILGILIFVLIILSVVLIPINKEYAFANGICGIISLFAYIEILDLKRKGIL